MTNYIPEEYYTQVRDSIIETIRKQSISRQMLPTRLIPGGIGTQQFTFDTATEVSEAMLSWAFVDNAEDVVGRGREHVPIPVLHKEFRIGRRDLAAAMNGGYDLDTRSANSSAYKVAMLENELVVDGFAPDDSTYEIDGIYQSAGNSYSTSADFGTPGNALKAVEGALDKLYEDDIDMNFDMYLNPKQYLELSTSIFGDAKEGSTEMPMVEKLLGGNIIKTSWLTAGTGLIMPSECPNYFGELIIAQDATVEFEVMPKSKDLWGRVYECVVPVIYEENAFCTLTTI